jgi:hypothetical protein
VIALPAAVDAMVAWLAATRDVANKPWIVLDPMTGADTSTLQLVGELAEETDLPSGDALAAELTRFLREEDQRRDNGDDVARDQ